MKEILDFFIKVNKLKEMPRTGWVLRQVKNPETIAEHTFGVAMASWILAIKSKSKLNLTKIIKRSLVHDLCEVYAGDVTPFFYYIRDLPKNKKEREKFLRKYVRLLMVSKEGRGIEKSELEKKSLLKLIKNLNPEIKKEIFSSWKDFERRSSGEGNFARQIDKIETLLQAIEYFGTGENSFSSGWWEESEEFTEHPLLLNFLKVIEKKFYQRGVHRNKRLENILEFILHIFKLKKMPRLYWTAHRIKNPETVAGHVFTVALMAWVLGREKKELNMEKLLKMALCHELSAVYTGDTIPYIKKLPKNIKKRREVLKKWPRLPEDEKARRFLKEYKEEKEALFKLTANLEPNLKKEIIGLWDEYRRVSSLEARFLSQINNLAVLFQGLLYQKKYKGYFAHPLWEWAFEKCDDPVILEFLQELDKKLS